MPFNVASADIYALQLWVCTSRHLNLYKIEQVETRVTYGIIHIETHVGYKIVMQDGCVYSFKFWIVKIPICALVKLEVIVVS